MNLRRLRVALIVCCLLLGAAGIARAQGKPGGGGPPHGPGGFPNGPGSFPPAYNNGSNNGGSNPSSIPSNPGLHSPAGNSASHTGLRLGPVGRWWDDRHVQQTVGLRRDQQKRMDQIFNANKQAILDSYKTLQDEQARLQALSKSPNVDQATLFARIDAVSSARASLEKATSQMLLQIRQQMEPDQINKLQTLQ